MPRLPLLSPSQQVARHLREELQRGVWREAMPGIPYLAAELGLDAKTVVAALRLLEEDGILEHQGNGRRRRIVELASPPSPSLRLAILLGEAADGKLEYMTDLQHRLKENGHSPFFLKLVETIDFVRPREDSPHPGHEHHECGNAETYFLIGDALGKAMLTLQPK